MKYEIYNMNWFIISIKNMKLINKWRCSLVSNSVGLIFVVFIMFFESFLKMSRMGLVTGKLLNKCYNRFE